MKKWTGLLLSIALYAGIAHAGTPMKHEPVIPDLSEKWQHTVQDATCEAAPGKRLVQNVWTMETTIGSMFFIQTSLNGERFAEIKGVLPLGVSAYLKTGAGWISYQILALAPEAAEEMESYKEKFIQELGVSREQYVTRCSALQSII